MMSKERNFFAIAVLFSAIWHFFWISTVCIIITPSIHVKDEFTKVTFLGPILEKTAFEMMVEEAQPRTETLYRTSMIIRSEEHLDVEGPKRASKKETFTSQNEGKTLDIRKKYQFDERDKPPFFINEKAIFYHIGDYGLNRFIEGPAKNRVILFKPDFPYIAKKVLLDEENFITKLKFTLSTAGNVETVEPVVSSGYPDIDMKCMQYLKQWKFSPGYVNSGEDSQWGIVTLNIRLQ